MVALSRPFPDGANERSAKRQGRYSSLPSPLAPVLFRFPLHCRSRRSRVTGFGFAGACQALTTEAFAEFIRSGGVWETESNMELLDVVSIPATADWDPSLTMERINL
jgi:hypothetical protein